MFRNEEQMESCLFLNLVLFLDVLENNNSVSLIRHRFDLITIITLILAHGSLIKTILLISLKHMVNAIKIPIWTNELSLLLGFV